MVFTLGENVQFLQPINMTARGAIINDLQKASDYIRSFFSGTAGKVALTGIKVGAGVGIAGAGIGAGLNAVNNNVPNITTGKGLSSWILIAIVAFILILVIRRK